MLNTATSGANQTALVSAVDANALADEIIAQAKAAGDNPGVQNLASHVRRAWQAARDHRQSTGIELRMSQSLRQRKGEYEADKLAEIRKMGGSEIYPMLTSVKCRAAVSWLKDAMLGSGSEKPWSIAPTPVPALNPQAESSIRTILSEELGVAIASGVYPTREAVEARMESSRKQLQNLIREKAALDAQDTEDRIEDILAEGGWEDAFSKWLDDFVTFPAAIMAGPLLRRTPVVKWQQQGGSWVAVPSEVIKEEFERVSPFDFYPDPEATGIEDGFMIRRHRLSPAALSGLVGAPGYSEQAIREVLTEHGRGGLTEWLTMDQRTGEQTSPAMGLQIDYARPVDAIEYWGTVSGSALHEWGMEVDNDPIKMYQANVWLIGTHVIKAVLNPDPLGRKPFGRACYEEIPGSFWGNGVPDLIRDVQNVCAAASRAMVNNMAIASGPQVWMNTERLASGETVEKFQPWRIWQFTSDWSSSAAPPMDFFQPQMHSVELMNVFTHFSTLADEYAGIPRYVTGDSQVGGAGRTASGLSMLMGNATKLIKHVVGNVDRMLSDMLTRVHLHLIHVRHDPLIRGDISVVAKGSQSVVVRDMQQMRRQELLAQSANPLDTQIIGLDGRAVLWRENLKNVGINPDSVVPPAEVLKERQAMMQAQQQAQAAQQMAEQAQPGTPAAPAEPGSDPMMGANGGYPADMGFNA